MGYMHINNLYKDQRILAFRECYALEKIHGTSANVRWDGTVVWFSSGGEKHERFVGLFDVPRLTAEFREIGHAPVTVYGEAYGGSQQGQSWRYGATLRFVAFDVKVGDVWLAVPQAADLVARLGLEFVSWTKCPTDIDALNSLRDMSSDQAIRNGVEGFRPREGVVLRPPIEVITNNGERVMAKHKRDDERETASPRAVVDPAKQKVLDDAEAIAVEWVTPTRLEHVLDKLGPVEIEDTRAVIVAMTEDVLREGAGELVDSREARAAIGRRTAQLFKARLQTALGATK